MSILIVYQGKREKKESSGALFYCENLSGDFCAVSVHASNILATIQAINQVVDKLMDSC